MSARAIRRCSRVASRPSARRQACCRHSPAVTEVSPEPQRPPQGDASSHLAEGHGDSGGDTGHRGGIREVLQEDAVALQQDVGLPLQWLGICWRAVRHRVLQLAPVRCHLHGDRAQPGSWTPCCPPPCPHHCTLSPVKDVGRTQK